MSDLFSEILPIAISDYIHGQMLKLEGWCYVEKAEAMCKLILETKPTALVEIGVFGGRSFIPQALAIKYNGTGIAIGLDAWKTETAIEGKNDPANDEWWKTKVDMDQIHRGCLAAISAAGVERQCVIFPINSHYASVLFRRDFIDILHIDGCHSEESSTRDVKDWLPLVRRQGYIWVDDLDWPSTEKAVQMLEKSCDRVTTIQEKCALFQKK